MWGKGVQTSVAIVEISVENSQTIKKRNAIILSMYLKACISYQGDTCISMFIFAPFTIAGKWDECRCPSTDEYKMGYIYTMEFYQL